MERCKTIETDEALDFWLGRFLLRGRAVCLQELGGRETRFLLERLLEMRAREAAVVGHRLV